MIFNFIFKNLPKILKKSSKLHIKCQKWIPHDKNIKNDISHHGILLNLIFARFYQIFPEKPDSGSRKTGFRIRKTGYPIPKFICVKTYLVEGVLPKNFCQIGQIKQYSKIRISGKTGSRIRIFLA